MVSDSIINPTPSGGAKDFGKKKRANRSAKLKQNKLDARREQWLSQGGVRSKGGKGEQASPRVSVAASIPREKEMKSNHIETENGSVILHDFDLDSPGNSPTGSSVLGGTDSGSNFTGSSSSSSSSSSSGGCCSGSITEEEGEDDNDSCLDDWEAVADALAASDDANNNCNEEENQDDGGPCLEPDDVASVHKRIVDFSASSSNLGSNYVDVTQEYSREKKQRASPRKTRAWMPDDAFRPQSLPNLSKQRSLPNNDRREGGMPWGRPNGCSVNVPSSCPVCTEDLDLTDASFMPCSCGFQVCLFCYKKMLELDGRCPNCRKVYNYDPGEVEASVHGGNQLTIRLARSSSMIARS